jgi:hypothetical protein
MACPVGDMVLSPPVQEQLWHIATAPAFEPLPATTIFRYGGRWHCPADGGRMTERAGYVQCDGCGRCIPGVLIYQLIEGHSHKHPPRPLPYPRQATRSGTVEP